MTFLKSIDSTGYEVLISLTLASVIAQLIKIIADSIKKKSLNLSLLFSTGGMPSSHSSTVCAMATSIGLIEGWDSTLFAFSVCFALIIMYDSAGVRGAVSKQAIVLNQIIQELLSSEHKFNKIRLKELLGHTPKEVFAGAFLGIGVSLLIRLIIASSN